MVIINIFGIYIIKWEIYGSFFLGVRGSIPTPGKEFMVYGGNTSCVEIKVEDQIIIFDMGSGIKNLGDSLLKRNIIILIFLYLIFIMIILVDYLFLNLLITLRLNLI